MKILNVADAIQKIQSGNQVFIHGAAATTLVLVDELVSQASRLKEVTLYHLHTEGEARYAHPEYEGVFNIKNFFVGTNLKSHWDGRRVDYIPTFLSEVPLLFSQKRIRLDVALIQVSPPDQHGYCSLGTSVDIARAAVEHSAYVIAEVNQQMPRVHGDGLIHVDQIHAAIETDRPLLEHVRAKPSEIELKIGRHVASLVEDGSTLQIGIGNIPDAALACLQDRKDLGIHSEMWSDGVLDLIQSGVVTNRLKKVHPHKTVSGFITGSQAVYQFIHDNPSVIQLGSDYVNRPSVIARNPKVVAINSAVEVDLTGQVCADSIGRKIISGVGGQVDFIYGASLSEGGKPIIAMTSRSKKCHPRIVPMLRLGAGVVTTRAHIHYIVTEYGIADLFGKSIRERIRALIDIAHPDDRENLERESYYI